jgi:hypothetical protein
MDRGQRARHHRSRHLDSLPNTPRRQRTLQSPPHGRGTVPLAISRPVWRMRRGSALWRPHPGRPRGPLLPLPEHLPPAPSRREAALLTALRPRQRTRRTRLGRSRKAFASSRTHRPGLRRRPRRHAPGRDASSTHRTTNPAPAARRRLPGRRDHPGRPEGTARSANQTDRRARPSQHTRSTTTDHQSRPQETDRRVRSPSQRQPGSHDLRATPAAHPHRLGPSYPHPGTSGTVLQDPRPPEPKGGAKSTVTRKRPIAFQPSRSPGSGPPNGRRSRPAARGPPPRSARCRWA